MWLQFVKKKIKKILVCIAKLFHADEPLRAIWRGYKQWKFAKNADENYHALEEAKKIEEERARETARETAKERAKIKAIEAEQMIANAYPDIKNGIVYIFQHSYFSRDGEKYISGGGERYATDLSVIIRKMSYLPIIIQLGLDNDLHPWLRLHDETLVLGLNCRMEEYPLIIQNFKNGKMHIYSGFVYWGKRLLTPNVMISHGITWDNPAYNANLEILKNILYSAQTLVSVDTSTICFLRSAFANDLGQKSIPMLYIPNYTDTSVYRRADRPRDEKIHITFPRRCAPERGFWLMVQVLPSVLEKYPNVEFEFIGYVHEQSMNTVIEKLQADFPGRVSQRLVDARDMPAVYQGTDITLVPTLYSEGTSLSCIEAMACGNAVIATDIGGLPDLIINEYNGLLIPPDEKALYQAICRLIDHPDLLRLIRENAARVAQCFSKSKWEKRWEKVLQDQLSQDETDSKSIIGIC